MMTAKFSTIMISPDAEPGLGRQVSPAQRLKTARLTAAAPGRAARVILAMASMDSSAICWLASSSCRESWLSLPSRSPVPPGKVAAGMPFTFSLYGDKLSDPDRWPK